MYNFPCDHLEEIIRCSNKITPVPEGLETNIRQTVERIFLNASIHCEIKEIRFSFNFITLEVEVTSYGDRFEKCKRLEPTMRMRLVNPSINVVPSKKYAGVCIIIPKKKRDIIGFGYCYQQSKISKDDNPMKFVLGLDSYDTPVVGDLTKLQHILIGGATGSGKSICVHNIISSILCHADPYSTQFIMVDPKQVELVRYENLHKSFMPVPPIYNSYRVLDILYNLNNLIDINFKRLKEANCSNIEEFNLSHEIKMQYCVVVIDELAELILKCKKEAEIQLSRILQLGRAAGIHVIAATQRPDHQIVTGLLKVNFPTSICLKVRSSINSRIVIEQNGGESLLGNGDSLLASPYSPDLIRFQCAYTSNAGTKNLIDYINNQF